MVLFFSVGEILCCGPGTGARQLLGVRVVGSELEEAVAAVCFQLDLSDGHASSYTLRVAPCEPDPDDNVIMRFEDVANVDDEESELDGCEG